MEAFTNLTGIVAPLPRDNINTDAIIPAGIFKLIGADMSRIGEGLFLDWRQSPDGDERPDFVLNDARFRFANILLSGRNFGCGSSREHAVWALLGAGIRCVVAESFADIFYNNCFKNGLLPITLNSDIVDILFEFQGEIEINLKKQSVKADNKTYHFDVDSERKRRLINGLDDIDLTLQYEDQIRSFEVQYLNKYPWL